MHFDVIRQRSPGSRVRRLAVTLVSRVLSRRSGIVSATTPSISLWTLTLSTRASRLPPGVSDTFLIVSLGFTIESPISRPIAPATGGYTPREIIRIIQGLAGLRLIGADVVEVAPAVRHLPRS